MKKSIYFSLILATVLCADANVSTQQVPTQDFGAKVDQKVALKYNAQMETLSKRLEELERMPKGGAIASPSQTQAVKSDFDTKSLPIVQGTYIIKKDGKVVKSGALVSDGGAEMYLTKENNKAVQKIAQDHVVYKVGSTSTTTPIVNNRTVTKSDGFKPEINEFSSVQTPVNPPRQLPTVDEMLKLTKPQ